MNLANQSNSSFNRLPFTHYEINSWLVPRVIASCVYGKNHIPFVYTFLESITQHLVNQKVVIGVNSFDSIELQMLQTAYPQVSFVLLKNMESVSGLGTHAQRASLKVCFWSQIFTDHIRFGESVAFMDIDCVVLKNPFPDLLKTCNVILTLRRGKWVLNSGVLFIKKNIQTASMFESWLVENERILKSRESNREAEKLNGGADQHSLLKALNLKSISYSQINTRLISNELDLCIGFVSCAQFNQTESGSLKTDLRVIHFKAGWHPILTEQKRYTTNRPRSSSEEFHLLWKSLYIKSKTRLYSSLYEFAWNQNDLVKKLSAVPYQDRGILNSEMLLVLGILRCLGIINIIESGRARGHSTYLLSEYLKDKEGSLLISIDYKKDSDAIYALENLKKFEKTKLFFGHANTKLPKLARENFTSSNEFAVVLDGPKSYNALYLTSKLIRMKKPPRIIFMHDLKKFEDGENYSPQRFISQRVFERIFFSDDFTITRKLKSLDLQSLKISMQTQQQIEFDFYSKNSLPTGSYGPTIAVIIPTKYDRKSMKRLIISPFSLLFDIYQSLTRYILSSLFYRAKND